MKLHGRKIRALLVFALLSLNSSIYALGPEHTGSWFNPDQSGHGFSFELGEWTDGSPYVVAYWYVYDNEGSPWFLVGQGFAEDHSVEVEFLTPWGMLFGEFDPQSVTRTFGGTGRFTFRDANNGTFSYFPSQQMVDYLGHSEITIPIVKLFSVSQPETTVVEIPVESNAVVDRILGAFEGWDGDTVIELMNGQVWQQAEYHYQWEYQFQPDVVIYQRGLFWYASIDTFGGSEHVKVKRIK